jgi:predicted phage tail protein
MGAAQNDEGKGTAMNTVILHGNLRERFGEEFKVSVRDPAEAFRAMSCQLDGLRDMFRVGEYVVVREMPNGELAITEDMLYLKMDNCRLHFLPMPEGSSKKKGAIKTILGVAIIVGSTFIPGSQAFLGMSLKTAGIMFGASLALGGAALLLAPTPRQTGTEDRNDSFLFGGSANSARQDFAVPITYGMDRVTSIPITSQIVTTEYYIGYGQTLNNVPNGVGGGGGNPYGEQNRVQEY